MKNTPINSEVVNIEIEKSGLKDLGDATIREIVGLVNKIHRVLILYVWKWVFLVLVHQKLV